MTLKGPREANGPNGYPVPGTNLDFDEAVKKVLERRKADAEQAERFLEEMSRRMKEVE